MYGNPAGKGIAVKKLPVSRLDALIAEQEGLERIDKETIEAIQLKKLNRLLAREKARGGFYRNLPERIASLERMCDLPFTTEEDLAHHAPSMLLCSQAQIQKVLSDATSGTTGAAKRVFYTENDLENTVRLYMAGLGELIYPGSVTMICFPFSGPYGLGGLIAEAIERLGARPIKAGPFLHYGEYAALLEIEKPDTFVGMPVQLLSILRYCGVGSLRRALVSGDACPENVIRSCEKLLDSKLFPHYGSREMGMAGAICCQAHIGMHLRENHIIAEIVDEKGQVQPHGEWGELVITTIGMEALPLVRYRTGDYARILPSVCPCGSATLRLDRIERRSGGLSAAHLDDVLFEDPAVIECCYEIHGDQLNISVLNSGDINKPLLCERLNSVAAPLRINLEARKVSSEDSSLYHGKRILQCKEG